MFTNASEKFSWQIATPESKGLDSKILRNLHKEFEELKHGYINSFIVIKRNAIVFEEYYDIDYAELTKDKKKMSKFGYLKKTMVFMPIQCITILIQSGIPTTRIQICTQFNQLQKCDFSSFWNCY